jgi:hypothetical protein
MVRDGWTGRELLTKAFVHLVVAAIASTLAACNASPPIADTGYASPLPDAGPSITDAGPSIADAESSGSDSGSDSGADAESPDAGAEPSNTDAGPLDEGPAAADARPAIDVYREIFDSVDQTQLALRLGEMTGASTVTAGGTSFRITERWSPAAKARFRAYWKAYFGALTATVSEQSFPIPNLVGETEGHNLQAVLPGRSPDSIVIIVHYDSVGVTGHETENPAADDDGSGLAIEMEAARILAAWPNRTNTVRFVAADYEEISDNLAGDVAYADYLQTLASMQGFRILAVADNDQGGWSCWSESLCASGAPAPDTAFRLVSCSGDALGYDYPQLRDGITEVATTYSTTMTVHPECDSAGDTDHYPFWQRGVPAFVIQEYSPDRNPHYDAAGDDTMRHIDLPYLFHIAQIAITYQAQLVGIVP